MAGPRIFPTFRHENVELEYLALTYPSLVPQARDDKGLGVICVVILSVALRMPWVWHLGLPKSLLYGSACLLLLVPLVALLLRQHDMSNYIWPRIIMLWTASTCYHALVLRYEERAVGPSCLALVMLLRSRVPALCCLQIVLRLPVLVHIPTQAAGLLITLGSNVDHCRWAYSQEHQPRKLSSFVYAMRGALWGRGPLANSFVEPPVGACTVALGFVQVLFGFVVPCYIVLLLELRGRHNFLRSCYRIRRRQLELQGGNPNVVPMLGPWEAGRLLSWHLLWLGPLVALACWHLAELAAVLLLPTQGRGGGGGGGGMWSLATEAFALKPES